MAAMGDDAIGLIVSCDAGASFSGQGRELSLAEGEASVVLANEPGVLLGCRHLGMSFPREALASRLKHIEDTAIRPIAARSESLRLLVNYLNGLPDGLSLREPALRRITLDHIYDLAALTICPERPLDESNQTSLAAARLRTAVSYIAAHFQEPELSVATVAVDQGVSSRYLQRLFETTGTTFTEHVSDLRLQRAFTLLTETRDNTRRISDIALQVGFSDVSHFNRLFRRRFGDSPSGVLRQNRG
jgi:AraC-like DNA-binding protein